MDKKTKRTLKKGAVLEADLKGHSITTTLSACGRSGTEDTQDTQEISIVTKVANQGMSKVDVEGPTNTQDSTDKHTESEEQESDE